MQPLSVRSPAVAGRFYPGRVDALAREVDAHLSPESPPMEKISGAIGCVVPHAGYMYSGHVAGAVYRLLPTRSRYIILGPNHWGRGAPLALMSSGQWLTPLGRVYSSAPKTDSPNIVPMGAPGPDDSGRRPAGGNSQTGEIGMTGIHGHETQADQHEGQQKAHTVGVIHGPQQH